MKKIFAIALALVMVLSMASAFASACVTGPFDWACSTTATKCGKATVEVVPYVKTNASCDGVAYVESNCAAAINGEHVYFALKLTVDKDVDPEWWAKVNLTLTTKGLVDPADGDHKLAKPALTKDDSEDGWVFYFQGSTWTEATEDADFDIADVMNKCTVKEYAKTKVCLTLKSENAGTAVTVGDFYVEFVKDAYGANWLNVYTKKGGDKLVIYKIVDEKVVAIDYSAVCGEADYAAIKAFMGLEIGTCVTEDAIKANFGWKEKVESCFSWSAKGTAVVDTDCVVAIPKTGDVSVVAYAVMAVVAAAGTMLKK